MLAQLSVYRAPGSSPEQHGFARPENRSSIQRKQPGISSEPCGTTPGPPDGRPRHDMLSNSTGAATGRISDDAEQNGEPNRDCPDRLGNCRGDRGEPGSDLR